MTLLRALVILALVIALIAVLTGRWDFSPRTFDLKIAFDLDPIRNLSADLSFRAPTVDDRSVLHEIMNDADVIEAHRLTPADRERWKLIIDDPEISAWRRAEWIVGVERSSGEIVGLATVGPTPSGYSGLSIGLLMRAGYRRSGYGTQLAAAMIIVMQHTYRFDVWAFTSPENQAVIRILERLGYEAEPELVQFEASDDESHDHLAYGCGRRHGGPDSSIWG